MLRQVDVKESEVISSAAIINYVQERGFKNIITIKKNSEGRLYIKEDGKIYIHTDEPSGEKIRFKNIKTGLLMAETLGKFHNAAEGFAQTTGIKVKVNWGRTMEKYRNLTVKIEKFSDYLQRKEKLTTFEQCTKEYVPILLKRAKASMKILRSMNYIKALENSMKRKEICINEISKNTGVISNNKLVITKIFDLGYNMVEEDLACLIKKLIEETGDKQMFEVIVNKYCEFRPLEEASKDIIKALVSYPSDSIKVISKYMKNVDNGDELIEKFKRYVQIESKTDILGV
jgi:CotS family spore coat protein